MAVVKVKGFSVSKGNFQGHDYHKLVVHVLATDKNCVGERAEQYKVNWETIPAVFRLNLAAGELSKVTPHDFMECIGKKANVYFDKYKNLDMFEVISESQQKEK